MRRGKAVAAMMPLDEEDYFSMRLADAPEFIAIERGRAQYKAEGGIPLYAEPHWYASGIVHVLVDGVPVVESSRHTAPAPAARCERPERGLGSQGPGPRAGPAGPGVPRVVF